LKVLSIGPARSSCVISRDEKKNVRKSNEAGSRKVKSE
jgi:hypothetical protein